MEPVRDGARRTLKARQLFVVAALMLAFGFTHAAPVDAECNPEGVLPSLAETAMTAERIFIGDVIAVRPGGLREPIVDGRSSRFTLQVRTALRGIVPPVIAIEDVITRPCFGPIVASAGDRVVLLLDATEPLPPGTQPGSTLVPATFNTVAWIIGQAPAGWPVDRVTQADVAALVGPGSQGVGRIQEDAWTIGSPAVLVVAFVTVGAVLGGVIVFIRRRLHATAP